MSAILHDVAPRVESAGFDRLEAADRSLQMEEGMLKITAPSHTGLPPEERAVPMGKSVKALVGSRMEVRLESNRPLRAGRAMCRRSHFLPSWSAWSAVSTGRSMVPTASRGL